MPHTYECPMRWADMDLLGHVNNVTYLDYVAEAREDLFAGHPAASAPVSRHQVEFAKPLVFRREPVLVDTWVTDIGDDSMTLAHEVYDEPADELSTRTVYLRAVSVLDHHPTVAERELAEELRGPALDWRPVPSEQRPAADTYPLTVRRTDIGEQGLVRAGVFFEYVQEARIRFLMNLHTRGELWSHHVIARTDLDYLAPLHHRQRQCVVDSWVSHLGSRSFTIASEVRDGDLVIARAVVVLVCFDPETQRTTGMSDAQRARLERELRD
ncbi:MAG: thioesterase family protein [Marmoricola sp.]